MRRNFTWNDLIPIYYAYFHSKMAYLASFWGQARQSLIQKIRVLQNSAIRIMMGVKRRDHHNQEIYEMSGIMSLNSLIKTQLSIIIFNHRREHKLLQSSILSNNQIHSHLTRTANDIALPIVKSTKYGINGIMYQAISTFNHLPIHIKSSSSLRNFKRNVKLFFRQQHI